MNNLRSIPVDSHPEYDLTTDNAVRRSLYLLSERMSLCPRVSGFIRTASCL